ncbi:MAG: hypothetical protein JNL70_01020 [Saprospiraceae bacterium]|nr:hypothetical protein [Saprospiraceae bacterium]
MKKTLTTILFLSSMTLASAQLLSRSEMIKDKKEWVEKHFYVNLDTMPYLKYMSVNFNTCRDKSCWATVNIGDGNHVWNWIDESLKPIQINGYVDGLNKLSRFNWIVQTPVYNHWISEGSGSLRHDWLLKRKE